MVLPLKQPGFRTLSKRKLPSCLPAGSTIKQGERHCVVYATGMQAGLAGWVWTGRQAGVGQHHAGEWRRQQAAEHRSIPQG